MITTVLGGGATARFVSLEDEPVPDALHAQLAALAATGDCPAYHPDVVTAMARGGVMEAGAQRYGYLVVSDRGRGGGGGVLAAAPIVVTSEVLVDLLSGPGLLRRACDVVRRFPRLFGVTTLCVGTALDQAGGALVRPGAVRPAALGLFDEALAWAARVLRCSAVIWKDIATGGELHRQLQVRGYHGFVALPGSGLELAGFSSLHDYLTWIDDVASSGDLRRKIRNAGYDSPGVREHLGRRGDAARQLAAVRRRAAAVRAGTSLAAPLVFESVCAPTAGQLDQMWRLYEAREAQARFRWTRLSRTFFARLAQLPQARFSLCRSGDRLLGFSSAVICGGRFVTLRSGVELDLARRFSIPVLLVLRDIETAIDERCAQITLGPTGYELKARFGVTFTPTVAMTRMSAPLAAPLTPLVCRAVDAANRRAGIHELHRVDFRSAWDPGP